MIDLALKMLLDEKARFAATVMGVGFAAALVLIQVGIFFGLLENASITIDRLDADLWVTSRNAPNVDFGNPFPEGYVHRVRSIPGVARADNLIVWYAIVALPTGAKESGRVLRAGGLPRLAVPLGRRVGRPGRPPPRPVRDARRLGRAAVRAVPRGRVPRVQRPSAQDHRPDPRGPVVHHQPDRVRRLPAGAVALRPTSSAGGRRSSSSGSSRAPTRRPSAARSAAGCRTTTSTVATSGRRASRGYWIESTGLGLTLALTVALGALVGVVIVGADALCLHDRAPHRLRHRQGTRGRESHRLRHHRRAGDVRGDLRIGLALVLAYGLEPALARLDMKMIMSPDADGHGLCRDAGALPGGRVALVPQGGVAGAGDGVPGVRRVPIRASGRCGG